MNRFRIQGEKRAPNGKKGATLNTKIRVDLMRQLLALAEEWAKAVGTELDPAATAATRQRIEQAAPKPKKNVPPAIALGVHMPIAMAQEIVGTSEKQFRDGLCHKLERKKGSILRICVEEGLQPITAQSLMDAYPDTKPSLNLVALLAFSVGLKKFKEKSGVTAAVKTAAVNQHLAEKWSQKRRASMARRLRQKADKELDSARQTFLKSLADLMTNQTVEYLDRMEGLLTAELGNV